MLNKIWFIFEKNIESESYYVSKILLPNKSLRIAYHFKQSHLFWIANGSIWQKRKNCRVLFFFFWQVHTRGGGEIQTSDLCFLRRGPQPIELPLEDHKIGIYSFTLELWSCCGGPKCFQSHLKLE
jgi:hypothetical protein